MTCLDHIDDQLAGRIKTLATQLISTQHKIVTVESCTGGRIASLFTAFAGSSAWFDRAFVTYSNASKVEMVGVRPNTLAKYGAVSEPVAREMALGGCRHSEAKYSISVTGIAGPDGGSQNKPVGMVCFAWAGFGDDVVASTQYFKGDRGAVREKSTHYAIERAIAFLKEI